jgi:hypothetical protein
VVVRRPLEVTAVPPALPVSLARLLSLLRDGFSAPTFDVFCWLVHGFIGRVGDHTVTGVWQAARLAGVLHHSRAHDFFARRRWSPDRLGLLLAGFALERLLAPGAPVRIVVDDSLFPRSGRKVFGAGFHFDQDQRTGRLVRFGNAFVCLGLLVRLPGLGRRAVCLPLLFRLWRPPAVGGEQRTKVALGYELVALIAERFPDRRLELVADGYYSNKALRGLPERVAACVLLRQNAALWAPPPQRRPGERGRPRKKGQRIGTPAEIAADPATRWQPLELERGDATERIEATTVDGLWYSVLKARPVRVVIVRDPGNADRPLLAVLSTDPELDAADILSRYADRWAIEVAFQQAKSQLGVGQARNRVERAVERTVPFGFLCQTLTLIWYALNGDPTADTERHRRTAPWYRQKRAPSFADMLAALRRELIRAEFRAQHRRHRSSPKTHPRRSTLNAASG